jgi:prepilin-type processing-associated H-X9-DG protein
VALDVRPTRFGYDEPNRSLLVEWSDGVEHRIPFNVLRQACPCAACKGEPGFRGRFSTDPMLHRGEDELADVSLVGAYGLNVVWADGHNTGIYTYERLRELGIASR